MDVEWACRTVGFLSSSDGFPSRHEPVPPSRDGFDISWLVSQVAQRLTEPIHGRIETAVKIHKGTVGPQTVNQFFTADDVTGGFKKREQDSTRLVLQPNAMTMLPQVRRDGIDLEYIEPDLSR